MVVIQPETDESGLPIWKMIEWEGMMPKEDELLDKAKEQEEKKGSKGRTKKDAKTDKNEKQ